MTPKVLRFALIAFLALPATVRAIEVTSTHLRIWGGWTEQWRPHLNGLGDVQTATGTFDLETDESFLQESISSPLGSQQAGAELTPFTLDMQSDSAPFMVELGDNFIESGQIDTFAESKTRFMPEGGALLVSVTASAIFSNEATEQDMTIRLLDLTEGTALLYLEHLDDFQIPFAETHELQIDPSHEFELTISGWITSWDGKFVDMSTAVDLSSTPVPVADSSSTGALLAAAMLILISVFRIYSGPLAVMASSAPPGL